MTMFPHGWWLHLTLLTVFGIVYCENCSYNDVKLTYPSKYVRPVTNWTMPTTIHVDFRLVSIISLDTSQQIITTIGYLLLKWKNEFISWYPETNCNITTLYITRDKFWQPDLYISEMTSTEDKSQINPNLIVNNNGEIQDKKSIRIVSSCKINIFKFPFDRQSCNISFSSYVYPVEEVNFMSLSNSTKVFEELKKKYFTPKGDWNLINITVLDYLDKGDTNYSRVIYTITIERVSEIYVLTFVMPVCFMVLLDMFSMFIQMDKADRLGFKITLILGFAMLLLILKDILPLSETPPLLGVFCCICMATMVCSIFASIGTAYILNLYKSQENVPDWIKIMLLNRLLCLLCFKRTHFQDVDSMVSWENSACQVPARKEKINLELEEKKSDTEGQLDISLEVKLLNRLMPALLKINKSLIDSKKKNIAKLQCSLAASVMDRLILIVYTLIMSVVSIYVITAWVSHES